MSRNCCFLSSVPTSGRCSSSWAIQSGLSFSSGFKASVVIAVEKSTFPWAAPEAAPDSEPRPERKLRNSLRRTLLESEPDVAVASPVVLAAPLVVLAGVSCELPWRLVGPFRGAVGVAAVWPVVGVAVTAAVAPAEEEVVVVVAPVVALGEERSLERLKGIRCELQVHI